MILNAAAAGYGSQANAASAEHAAGGYINVSCGNRGKQDMATDSDGGIYYTGDAPSYLPLDVEKFISTEGQLAYPSQLFSGGCRFVNQALASVLFRIFKFLLILRNNVV